MNSPRPTVILPTLLLMTEAERLIAQGHTVTLTVRGNSMLPLIRNGDRAVLVSVGAAALQRGMVVLAHTTDGQVVLHRIIGLPGNADPQSNRNILLQGDGNIGLTEQTTPDRVIALLTHVHRGRYRYACHSTGWCLLVAVWQALRPVRRPLLALIRRVDKYIR